MISYRKNIGKMFYTDGEKCLVFREAPFSEATKPHSDQRRHPQPPSQGPSSLFPGREPLFPSLPYHFVRRRSFQLPPSRRGGATALVEVQLSDRRRIVRRRYARQAIRRAPSRCPSSAGRRLLAARRHFSSASRWRQKRGHPRHLKPSFRWTHGTSRRR